MSSFETTPMTAADLEWWAEYQKARATMRWTTRTADDGASRRPMPSPRLVELLYGGWETEPEPLARFGR
jgi:hypothetical protein